MKIIAGGRGSGKTYDLIHEVAKDSESFFVAKDHNTVRWLRDHYRGIINPSQIISRVDLDRDGFMRGIGRNIKDIYIDDVHSGETLPDHWMANYYIRGIAVQAKDTLENVHISDTYADRIHQMYKDRRDVSKQEKDTATQTEDKRQPLNLS